MSETPKCAPMPTGYSIECKAWGLDYSLPRNPFSSPNGKLTRQQKHGRFKVSLLIEGRWGSPMNMWLFLKSEEKIRSSSLVTSTIKSTWTSTNQRRLKSLPFGWITLLGCHNFLFFKLWSFLCLLPPSFSPPVELILWHKSIWEKGKNFNLTEVQCQNSPTFSVAWNPI